MGFAVALAGVGARAAFGPAASGRALGSGTGWPGFGAASAAIGEGDPMRFLVKQGIYAFVGLIALAALSRFDYHRLRALAPGGVAVVLCITGTC